MAEHTSEEETARQESHDINYNQASISSAVNVVNNVTDIDQLVDRACKKLKISKKDRMKLKKLEINITWKVPYIHTLERKRYSDMKTIAKIRQHLAKRGLKLRFKNRYTQEENTIIKNNWEEFSQIKIEHALRPEPSDERVVQGFGYWITREDFQTLKDLGWLNDMVDVFAHDLLVVPVHLENHWCLAVIDFRDKTIRYYDSMGHPNNDCLNNLLMYLKEESLDKKNVPYDTNGWNIENVKDIPQQTNGSDCGVFTCMFAEYICRNAKITF